jgi:GNAT superfamily N-acetyltransferase
LAAADAAPVAAIIRAAFAVQPVPPDPPMSALRVNEADIVAHLAQGGGGVVAEFGGTLAGSALWQAKDCALYLSRIAVAPARRRCGIGRALLAAAEAAARAQGLPVLRLSTRLVLEDNRKLFASCGFVETGRTAHAGYAQPTSVDMAKRLSA